MAFFIYKIPIDFVAIDMSVRFPGENLQILAISQCRIGDRVEFFQNNGIEVRKVSAHITLSGLAAEKILFGKDFRSHPKARTDVDVEKARSLMWESLMFSLMRKLRNYDGPDYMAKFEESQNPKESEVNRLLRKEMKFVKEQLSSPKSWAAIQSLAAALMESGDICGQRVEKIISDATKSSESSIDGGLFGKSLLKHCEWRKQS